MPRSLKWVLGAIFVALIAAYLHLNRSKPADVSPGPASAGGAIVLRLPSFAINLNPAKMNDVESRQVATLMHVGLVAQTQEGSIVPMIAKSWRQEGNAWEFELAPGLSFSNGDKLTSADVVRSLCNAMQPSAALAWALASVARKPATDGKSVECVGLVAMGDQKVKIEETTPSSSLLDALSGPAGWILPGAGVKEGPYGVLPGAGPYTVKEVVADSKVVLVPRADGSPVKARALEVQFNYIPDDTQAAQQFAAGKLHVLDLTSPKMVELLTADGKLKQPGSLRRIEWDRYRVLIVNLKGLEAKGFTKPQALAFVKGMSAAVDRKKLETLAAGVARPFTSPYPPDADAANAAPAIGKFPGVKLTILTESDAFSDSIAASLPKELSGTTIDYKGVDKGVLLGSLFKGEFDLISIVLEAPVHSAEFWQALFTPGNPYSAVGVPIPGMEKLRPSSPEGVRAIGKLIAEQGNWVALLKEHRLQASAPGIGGVMFTPSGQTNLVSIGR